MVNALRLRLRSGAIGTAGEHAMSRTRANVPSSLVVSGARRAGGLLGAAEPDDQARRELRPQGAGVTVFTGAR